MNKYPQLAPTGILNWKHSPFMPLYFHMLQAWTNFPVSICYIHLDVAILLSLLLSLCSLFILFLSPCLPLHVSITVALSTVSLRCSFVYMYLDRDKSQPCWNAWAADLPSIVQLARWAFRATASTAQKRMHTLMKTTTRFAPTSSGPWSKGKLRGEKSQFMQSDSALSFSNN